MSKRKLPPKETLGQSIDRLVAELAEISKELDIAWKRREQAADKKDQAEQDYEEADLRHTELDDKAETIARELQSLIERVNENI